MAETTAKFDPLPLPSLRLRATAANNNNQKYPSGGEMEALPNPKTKDKFDRTSVKHILDQTAIEIVKKGGFVEDDMQIVEDSKLYMGVFHTSIGMLAQFYIHKFPWEIPEKRQYIISYMFYYLGLLQLFRYLMVRRVFMFTYRDAKSGCTYGLALSSKLSRSSNHYTLTIASAAESSWGKPPVKLTKSITEWYSSDGVLLKDLYSKDVEGLLLDYVKESNKRGMWRALLLSLIPCFWQTFLILALLKLLGGLD